MVIPRRRWRSVRGRAVRHRRVHGQVQTHRGDTIAAAALLRSEWNCLGSRRVLMLMMRPVCLMCVCRNGNRVRLHHLIQRRVIEMVRMCVCARECLALLPHARLDVLEVQLLWADDGSGPADADVRDSLHGCEAVVLHQKACDERARSPEARFAVDRDRRWTDTIRAVLDVMTSMLFMTPMMIAAAAVAAVRRCRRCGVAGNTEALPLRELHKRL